MLVLVGLHVQKYPLLQIQCGDCSIRNDILFSSQAYYMINLQNYSIINMLYQHLQTVLLSSAHLLPYSQFKQMSVTLFCLPLSCCAPPMIFIQFFRKIAVKNEGGLSGRMAHHLAHLGGFDHGGVPLIQLLFIFITIFGFKAHKSHMNQSPEGPYREHRQYLSGPSLPLDLWLSPLQPPQPPSQTQPSPRHLHASAVIGEKLYVLGGANSQGLLKENKIHVLDLNTLRWSSVESKGHCQNRHGMSSAMLRKALFLFGGLHHQCLTNDLLKFCPMLNLWTKIETSSSAPSPRQHALLIPINDSSLLVFGGIDLSSEVIFSDAYLYHDEWKPVSVRGSPSPRIKMGQAVLGNRIFVFGGEGPSQTNSLFFNDLFELSLDPISQELIFEEVSLSCQKPPKRSGHGMVALSESLLLICGGEGWKGNASTVLGDIWVFNLEEQDWREVQLREGRSLPRFDFTFAPYQNKLVLFGGFDADYDLLNNTTQLTYAAKSTAALHICEECLKEEDKQLQLTGTQSMGLSGGFIQSMALQINFPFRAIELIIDQAALLGARQLNLSPIKNREDYQLLSFEFEGDPLPAEHFLKPCYPPPILLNFILGAFRLGKTMLYINCEGSWRRVLLVSIDSKSCPNFEDSLANFSYLQNTETGETLPANGRDNKKAIRNLLSSQLKDPLSVLSLKEGHRLLVFQLNILPTVEKAYYYELISYSKPDTDIKIYCNQKKNQLLEGIGISLGQHPQFSLRHYLAISKLERPLAVSIDHSSPIEPISYLAALIQAQRHGVISYLDCPSTLKDVVKECMLFKCNQKLENNQGILIYCNNHLIQRFRCPFGQLVPSKFFKKKIKESEGAKNLFDFVGVLHLRDEELLNSTKTRLRDKRKFKRVVEELTGVLKSDKMDGNEADLSALWDIRFSLNKEGSKKQRKE